MSRTVKRYTIVMIIGILLNEILSFSIEPLNLPLWLDMSGTALVAIVFEPAAGIIVAFVNNFLLSVFQYDASSIIYLALGASVAIISGTMLKDKSKITLKKVILCILYIILVTACLTAILTMWRKNGVSDLYWERYFFTMGMDAGLPRVLACGFGALVVKIPDMIVSAFIVAGLYKLLPKSLRHEVKEKEPKK